MSTLLHGRRRRDGSASARVDPRIAARRDAVAADEGRRRGIRRWTLLVLVAVAAAGLVSTRTPLFDVDRVVVEGASRTAADQIRAATGVGLGTPLDHVDAARAAAAVEALPWVAQAQVTKEWPGTLRVSVVERAPVGVIRDGDAFLLVDAEARVLERVAAVPPGAVVVEGVGGGAPGQQLDETARGAVRVASTLPDGVRDRVERVAVDDGELALSLQPTGRVRLGDATRLVDKYRSVATVFEQVDLACLATLDVRVPDRPVLTRDPRCATVSPGT